MPPPRSRPGDTTRPRGADDDQDDDSSSAPTAERPQLIGGEDGTAPSAHAVSRDPPISAAMSGFQIEGVLGKGAAGIVYQARQVSTGRKAAFKVLKPQFAEDPEYIRRLIEEAKALSALRHPGIIDILDFGALPNGQPYLVMELCEGLSLEEQLKLGGKPTLREALGLMDELLGALSAAHARGIIHRDVKPSNLFLATAEDGTRSLKVLDFGLARFSDRSRSNRPTLPGSILGTPDYMAPEQIAGKEVGSWTDIYATGGIAYRMLADRLPYLGRTGIAVITQKLEAPPPALRTLDPKVPAELEALVAQMMSADPALRPSLQEARARFAAQLEALDAGPHLSLEDPEDPSSRPTTFHRFDDQSASRRMVQTTPGALPPPGLSPPSIRTDLEPKLVTERTELEHAHVPDRGSRWLSRLGLLLFFLGAAGGTAWWLTHR